MQGAIIQNTDPPNLRMWRVCEWWNPIVLARVTLPILECVQLLTLLIVTANNRGTQLVRNINVRVQYQYYTIHACVSNCKESSRSFKLGLTISNSELEASVGPRSWLFCGQSQDSVNCRKSIFAIKI